MKLTGFDIYFDEEENRILVLKTPGTDGRAAVIQIKLSSETDKNALNSALNTGERITLMGDFEVQINKTP
jgi:hypothetical protein